MIHNYLLTIILLLLAVLVYRLMQQKRNRQVLQ